MLQGLAVLLVVSGVAFALFQFVGDPVSQMLPPDATAADREALTAALGLNDSAFVQYARFLGNAATGDFSYGIEGFEFRNGVITRPIESMLITGDMIGLWNSIIAAGTDPMEGMSRQIPTLAFSDLSFNS